MLVRGVDVRLKEIIHEVANELQCEVLELEVMPDHVHMLCEVAPQFGIHRFVKRVKGRSSRILRQEFDWLTNLLCNDLTSSDNFNRCQIPDRATIDEARQVTGPNLMGLGDRLLVFEKVFVGMVRC